MTGRHTAFLLCGKRGETPCVVQGLIRQRSPRARPRCLVRLFRKRRKKISGRVRQLPYGRVRDSSISSSSSAPVGTKPLLLYRRSARLFSRLQVRVTRSEAPKGLVRI